MNKLSVRDLQVRGKRVLVAHPDEFSARRVALEVDVLDRNDLLPFPQSLPEFQRLFPDDRTCAAYLERARWGDGFTCPHCQEAGEPFRIANAARSLGLP